eukprot:Gb_26042 [translate_table: standard]
MAAWCTMSNWVTLLCQFHASAVQLSDPCFIMVVMKCGIARVVEFVACMGEYYVITHERLIEVLMKPFCLFQICVIHSVHHGPVSTQYTVTGTTYAPEGVVFDMGGVQLEHPAHFPCLLHIAMCSALCNDSTLQYNPDKGTYEKIGESTEVALRVLAEKVGLPGFDSMPSALNMLSKHERASYCNHYWEHQFKKTTMPMYPCKA